MSCLTVISAKSTRGCFSHTCKPTSTPVGYRQTHRHTDTDTHTQTHTHTHRHTHRHTYTHTHTHTHIKMTGCVVLLFRSAVTCSAKSAIHAHAMPSTLLSFGFTHTQCTRHRDAVYIAFCGVLSVLERYISRPRATQTRHKHDLMRGHKSGESVKLQCSFVIVK